MTYADLTAELDILLHELENDDVPLDALTQKVQRCYALIREGRALLRTAEDAVARVLEADVDGEPPAEPTDKVAEPAPPAPKPAARRGRAKPAADEEGVAPSGGLPF